MGHMKSQRSVCVRGPERNLRDESLLESQSFSQANVHQLVGSVKAGMNSHSWNYCKMWGQKNYSVSFIQLSHGKVVTRVWLYDSDIYNDHNEEARKKQNKNSLQKLLIYYFWYEKAIKYVPIIHGDTLQNCWRWLKTRLVSGTMIIFNL